MDIFLGALKSKTVFFGLLLSIFGVLQTNIEMFRVVLTPEQFGLFSTVVGFGVIALRFVTSVPLEQK